MMMGWGRSQAEELHLEDLGGHPPRVAEGWPEAGRGGPRLVAISKPAVAIFSEGTTVNACNGAQLSIYPAVGSKCLYLLFE